MVEQHQQHHGYRVFLWLAQTVLSARWWVLTAVLGLTLGLCWAAQQYTKRKLGLDVFIATDAHAAQTLKDAQAVFGSDRVMLVLVEGDVFTASFLKRLTELERLILETHYDARKTVQKTPGTEALQKPTGHPSKTADSNDEFGDLFADFDQAKPSSKSNKSDVIESVRSLVSAERLAVTAEGAIRFDRILAPNLSDIALAELKPQLLTDSFLVPLLLDSSGQRTIVTVRYADMPEHEARGLYRLLQKRTAALSNDSFKISVSGQPTLGEMIDSISLRDSKIFLSLTGLFVTCVLIYVFRHPIGILAPLAVVVLSLIATFGTMALVNVPVSMFTLILPGFLLAVGIGDSVHVTSVYRDLRAQGQTNRSAIVHAIAETGMPVLFTTLTTMLGLLSFWMSSVEVIQDLGTAGAIGVFCALLYTVLLLPVLLSFNTKSLLGYLTPEQQESDLTSAILRWCQNISRTSLQKRRVITLTLTALLIATIGIIGYEHKGERLWGARLWHDPVSWVPNHIPDKKPFLTINEHMGGLGTITLLIERDAKDKSPFWKADLIHRIQKLEDYLLAFEHPEYGTGIVTNVTSMASLASELHRILTIQQSTRSDAVSTHDDRPHNTERLPKDQTSVSQLFEILASNAAETLRSFTSIDNRSARILIRTRWLDATSYAPLTKYIEEGIQKHIPDEYRVRPTGSVYTVATAIGSMFRDFASSFGTAFIVIWLAMLILFRSPTWGLLAMVPNLIPIVWVIGFMGFADIPLDFMNLMIGSILLGIAVDNTIHLLHHVKESLEDGFDLEHAIHASLKTTGRAILSSAAILCLGFGAQSFATLYNMKRFGYLLTLAIGLSVITNLIVTPAMLRALLAKYKKEDTGLTTETVVA